MPIIKLKGKLTDYVPLLELAPGPLLRQESLLSLETDPAHRHGDEYTLVCVKIHKKYISIHVRIINNHSDSRNNIAFTLLLFWQQHHTLC